MFNKEVSTKYRKISIDENSRVLFISDIHGDLQLFKRALAKVNYSDKDYLFLLGDIIEKGNENLTILDYLQDMLRVSNRIYVLSGNCDEVFRYLLPPVDKKKFLYYALEKKHSIINEMARRLKITITKDVDVDQLCLLFCEEFKTYYAFLNSFEHIININDKIILTHAGVFDISNIPSCSIGLLKQDNFYFKSKKQENLMIVGHYPTVNYCSGMASLNPILDYEKNIFCIDGGNNVCRFGQLNVLILDSLNSWKFDFRSVDHHPKIRILRDIEFKSSEEPFSLTMGNNEIEIESINGDFAFCRQKSTGRNLWVYEKWIQKENGKCFGYDATNLFLPIAKGEVVTLILYAHPFCMIKKEGTLSLIQTKDLVMEDATKMF